MTFEDRQEEMAAEYVRTQQAQTLAAEAQEEFFRAGLDMQQALVNVQRPMGERGEFWSPLGDPWRALDVAVRLEPKEGVEVLLAQAEKILAWADQRVHLRVMTDAGREARAYLEREATTDLLEPTEEETPTDAER